MMDGVVFLHSSASSRRQWSAIESVLGSAAHTPDFLGHGSRLAQSFTPALLRVEAEPIEQLLESLGGACVVGHSYGGAVAIDIARRRPDLVHALVVYEPVLFALLRSDPGSQTEWMEVMTMANDMRRLSQQDRLAASAARFVDFWSGTGAWDAVPSERKPMIAGCMPAIVSQFDALFSDDLMPRDIASLPPTLLVTGGETVLAARRVAQLLKTAQPDRGCLNYVEMEDAGHMGPITHAAIFNELVLDFLSYQEPLQHEQAAYAHIRM